MPPRLTLPDGCWPLLVLLVSCAESLDATALGAAAWSDDGTEIAVAVHHHTGTRQGVDLDQQVAWFVQTRKPDGSLDRTVTGERPGKVTNLYDMRKAGYLLVTEQVDEYAPTERTRVVLVRTGNSVAGAGQPVVVAETDRWNPTLVIPSRDGGTLARIAPSKYLADNAGTMTVEFLNSQSLAANGTLAFDFAREPGYAGVVQYRWMPDGDFVIADVLHAVAVTPGQPGSKPVTPPKCFSPVTSSGPVGPGGVEVSLDSDHQNLVLTQSAGGAGCD